MFTFIGICVVIFIAMSKYSTKFVHETKKTLSESKIVKKFNEILKTIGERNLDVVKQELIQCLDEFAVVKEQQFAFTLSQIRKSKKDVDNQLNAMTQQLSSITSKVKLFAIDHKGSQEDSIIKQGVSMLVKQKTMQTICEKLRTAQDTLNKREDDLNAMLGDFNSNLAIKKADISIMIADSTGIFSGSTADIKLDNLVKEFQTKVIEGKAAQDVHDKLNNKEEQSPVDYSACVEEFKSML